MPLSDYQAFYDKAMTSYRPQMDAETANYKAALADQGILSSTGGQGAIQSARQNWLAKANQSAMDEAYRQQGLAENQRQFDSNSALKVWEMLNARALGWRATVEGSKTRLPNQFEGFGNLAKTSFLAPKYTPGGMTGDPKEQRETEYVKMFDAPSGRTQWEAQLDSANADSAANRAIQRAYLKLAQDKDARERGEADAKNDPWAQMYGAALSNRDQLDEKGTIAGYQAKELPSDMIGGFATLYNIDVEREAAMGNPKAVRVYSILYPQTWRERLARLSFEGQRVDGVKPNAASLLRPHTSQYGEQPLTFDPNKSVASNIGSEVFKPNFEAAQKYSPVGAAYNTAEHMYNAFAGKPSGFLQEADAAGADLVTAAIPGTSQLRALYDLITQRR